MFPTASGFVIIAAVVVRRSGALSIAPCLTAVVVQRGRRELHRPSFVVVAVRCGGVFQTAPGFVTVVVQLGGAFVTALGFVVVRCGMRHICTPSPSSLGQHTAVVGSTEPSLSKHGAVVIFPLDDDEDSSSSPSPPLSLSSSSMLLIVRRWWCAAAVAAAAAAAFVVCGSTPIAFVVGAAREAAVDSTEPSLSQHGTVVVFPLAVVVIADFSLAIVAVVVV